SSLYAGTMIDTKGSNCSPACSRSRRRDRAHCAKASAPMTTSRARPSTMPTMNTHCKSQPVVDKIRNASVSVRVKMLSLRSEERRVGKECRSQWSRDDEKKKENIRAREET